MKRKAVEYILMILLLSPLLFIGLRSSHDWGDDFAGYITEAQNIAHGKPFYESRMVPQDYMPSYAPQYYSYGFPLLLAPVIRVFGVNFKAMDFYISCWLVLWALLVFYYLRSRFSFFTAASFVFILFVNPFFFRFKTEVISDIPFAFFFTLCMLFFIHRRELSLAYKIIFGLVIGFTIGIRDLGYFFPAMIITDMLLSWLSFVFKKINREAFTLHLKDGAITLVSCFIFVFIFSQVLFKSPGTQLGHFVGLYHSPSYRDTFFFNLDVYTRLFEGLFRHEVGRYTFALYYSTAFMLVLTVLGFIHLLFSKYKWELFLLVAYGLVVLLFPFASQGFRYFLPVLPIMILCAVYGAKSITLPVSINKYVAGFVFLIFMSLVNIQDIRAIRHSQHDVIWPGPMTDESKAVFKYINDSLPQGSLIATVKPRALMLFTDKRTCLIPKNATASFAADMLKDVHPDYVLHLNDVFTNIANDLAAYRHDTLIWEQNGNKLYRCAR